MERRNEPDAGPIVEIEARRAPLATVLGAVDAALASGIANLRVGVPLDSDDPRRAGLERLCAGDERVSFPAPGADAPETGVWVSMPAVARPESRTLPALLGLIDAGGLALVEVRVPGRLGPTLSAVGTLRVAANGSGTRRVRAAEVGLRSTFSRDTPGPPPIAGMSAERAEHLRHRARSSTMRARMDANHHRLSRERLQTRHERSRLLLAERRLGRSGPIEWMRWRGRSFGRRIAALPGLLNSAFSAVRTTGRRARRFMTDRRRSSAPPDSA